MLYLVLFDKVFRGLRGNVDRIYDDHFEAALYCAAQNNATKPLYKSPVTEYWIVALRLDESQGAVAERIYKPEVVKKLYRKNTIKP